MTVLIPMRAASYEPYLQAAIIAYAQENVAAGRWPDVGAAERSRADFASLLPQGLATPDNHLYEILASGQGAVVGWIWLAIERKHGVASGFVYDVEIKAEYRRAGHATRAFEALEPLASAVGASGIGLHVFGQNTAAQALYRKLGYVVTGINMHKTLRSGR